MSKRLTPWRALVLNQITHEPCGIKAIMAKQGKSYTSCSEALRHLRKAGLVACLMRGRHTVWTTAEAAKIEAERYASESDEERRARRRAAQNARNRNPQPSDAVGAAVDERGAYLMQRTVTQWQIPAGPFVRSVFELGRIA